MLNYNFDRIFKARGIEKPFTYLCKSGFSDNFATKIKNNRIKRIGLNELERLCFILKCTPNDFIEWVPDNDSDYDNNHPMNNLRKSKKNADMVKTINSIPVGKLYEIEQMIKNEIKK